MILQDSWWSANKNPKVREGLLGAGYSSAEIEFAARVANRLRLRLKDLNPVFVSQALADAEAEIIRNYDEHAAKADYGHSNSDRAQTLSSQGLKGQHAFDELLYREGIPHISSSRAVSSGKLPKTDLVLVRETTNPDLISKLLEENASPHELLQHGAVSVDVTTNMQSKGSNRNSFSMNELQEERRWESGRTPLITVVVDECGTMMACGLTPVPWVLSALGIKTQWGDDPSGRRRFFACPLDALGN